MVPLPAKKKNRRKKPVAYRPPAKKSWWKHLLAWLRTQKLSRPTRKLRVCETVSLGEKRFAAVLEYGGQKFLVGGAAQSVQLLTELQTHPFKKTLAAQQAVPLEVK
jgi:flagellar biogenesis protein FliO